MRSTRIYSLARGNTNPKPRSEYIHVSFVKRLKEDEAGKRLGGILFFFSFFFFFL